jgi:phospholipid/cholesterol/gamma-HCH transport system substrate-binding protein
MNKEGMQIQPGSFVRRHRSFFVGLFVIIPLVIIPGVFFYTFVKLEFMQRWTYLYAIYENSYGLTKGNPVTVSGMGIGYVNDILLEYEGRIRVNFKIRKQYQHLIKKDTKALLKQKNAFVGDWAIELTGGTKNAAPIRDNDTLISDLPVGIDKTLDQVTGTITLIQQILQQIVDGKGSIGKLLKEDSIAIAALGIEKNILKLTTDANKTIYKVDSLLFSITKVSENSNTLVDSLQVVMLQIKEVMGGVDTIIQNLKGSSREVEPLINQVKDELANTDQMLQSLQQGWLFKTITRQPADPIINRAP